MSRLGLDEAYQELKEQCESCGIEVPVGRNIIIHNNSVLRLTPMDSKRYCLKLLRGMIKKAKQEQFDKTQGSLGI